MGSIPGRGTKIPHATGYGQKIKLTGPQTHYQIILMLKKKKDVNLGAWWVFHKISLWSPHPPIPREAKRLQKPISKIRATGQEEGPGCHQQ